MVPTLSPNLVALDVLCCMGVGFLVAALRVAIPVQGGIMRFCADFCITLFALCLVHAYAAQASNAGVLRLYMLLALAIGGIVFAKVVAPYYLFVSGLARCILFFPLRVVCHTVIGSIAFSVKKWKKEQKYRKTLKKAKKRKEKQLQIPTRMLYNSNVDSYPFAE